MYSGYVKILVIADDVLVVVALPERLSRSAERLVGGNGGDRFEGPNDRTQRRGAACCAPYTEYQVRLAECPKMMIPCNGIGMVTNSSRATEGKRTGKACHEDEITSKIPMKLKEEGSGYGCIR